MGVSNQTLNNWFVRGVPGRKILQAAKLLDIRPEWLQAGDDSPLSEDQLEDIRRVMDASPEEREAWAKEVREKRPLLATGSFRYPELSRLLASERFDPVELESESSIKWHSSEIWAGYRGFWMRVEGHSMVGPADRSFPEDSLILVDPTKVPLVGQFVIARLRETNEHTFKQLVSDSGDLYLKPLNPAYPMRVYDKEKWETAGTVVDAKLPESWFG